MVVDGEVKCAAWIYRRTEKQHYYVQRSEEKDRDRGNLVVLGRAGGRSSPVLEVFAFDPKTSSLSDSPLGVCQIEGSPQNIAVHPSGDEFVCSTTNGCLLFEIDDQDTNIKLVLKELEPLKNSGPQKCLAFSTDGLKLACGGEDGHLRIFHWPSLKIILDEPKAHKSFRDMDISLDSQFLSSTSVDGSARIWKINEGVPLTLLARKSTVLDIQFLSEIHTVMVPDSETCHRYLDRLTISRDVNFFNLDEKFELCRFSRDGSKPFLFCTMKKGEKVLTTVWDISTWKKLGYKWLLGKPISSLSISLDGKYFSLGSNDGDICVVEVSRMAVCHWSKKLHLGSRIVSMDFCPSERVLLSFSNQWGAIVTKLDVPADWKEWQIYALLVGLFLVSLVIAYVLYINSGSFWQLPQRTIDPTIRPSLTKTILNDNEAPEESNSW